MRIGHVAFTWIPRIGGAELYIDALLAALESAGHVNRVYQADPGPLLRASDPRLRLLPRRRRFALHAFNLSLLGAALDLRREDRLVVHDTFHHLPVAWHRGCVAVSHGVTWDHPADRASNRRRRALAAHAWRRAHVVVANDSEFFREMGQPVAPGERFFSEIAPRRFLIPNVVDPSRFAPGPPLESLAGAQLVLVPRRLVPGRGAELAIEAFASAARSQPALTLILAGGFADSSFARRLFVRIRELGLSGRVLFTGPVTQERMLGLYRSARVTLIPSLCLEGTSLAALESMSAGTPVVATAVGGLKDLPALLAPAEPRQLAAALLDGLARRDSLAREQRAAVLARFRPELWREAWRRAIAA